MGRDGLEAGTRRRIFWVYVAGDRWSNCRRGPSATRGVTDSHLNTAWRIRKTFDFGMA